MYPLRDLGEEGKLWILGEQIPIFKNHGNIGVARC